MTAIAVTLRDMAKRAYGTGSLLVKHGAWYGSWRTAAGKRTTRKLGPVRKGRDGLTKRDAEGVLRAMILTEADATPMRPSSPTVGELAPALVAHLERAGRKPSHIETVRYHLSAHIVPALGSQRVTDISVRDVDRIVQRMLAAGRAAKTIRNVGGTLHSLLTLAVDRGLLERNPCQMSRLPEVRRTDDIRFLTQDELERVLAAAPPDDDAEIAESFPVGVKYGGPQAVRDWWPLLRLLVLTATMTGMRLGELRALRWRDLDYGAMKVRVRQSYVRGEYGAPKSRRSVRAVPLASRLVTDLDAHHQRTVWNQDSDLVLAHPHTGAPLDRVRLLQHFHAALRRADVRPVRIHDLRHTFATTVAASGRVSLRTLQEWMGHLDARTTQLYADYMPGAREAALLDEAFGQMDSNWTPIIREHGPLPTPADPPTRP
jgi:integrase